MHPIQIKIVNNLAKYGKANFNKIKLEEVDPSLFVYHLNLLIKEGYIQKEFGGDYSFTKEGFHALASLEDGVGFTNSNVNSYIIVVLRFQDKYLVVNRKVAPFRGYTGFLFQSIVKDHSLLESVSESTFKEGIFAGNLKLDIVLEVLYRNSTENSILQHSMMFVVTGTLQEEIYNKEIKEGVCTMMKKEELLLVEKGYSNTKDILENISKEGGIQYLSKEYFDDF